MPTLRVRTLGCKVNQYETEYVRQGLVRAGFREAQAGEPADLCVVNTCTVTLESDYKCRKLIRQLARENPHAEIVVMGCYATRAPREVAALPGVVEVLTDKRQIPRLFARFGLAQAPAGIASFGRLHRALVKVQDGCTMECSYCVVPTVRPALWSRPVDDVLAEVRRLVEHGHLEIVLSGIHLGHYGVEPGIGAANRPGTRLAGLVERILSIEGEFRVRLSSLEAAEATPELLDLLASHPRRLCPHLHLPMQSGADRVLRRMRRRASAAQFIEQCLAMRERLDRPSLTTDVIVGFPGETDADFEATCRAVETVGFSRVHVFRFSAREGTPAARMPDQLPPEVKRDRATRLAAIGRRLAQRYAESLCGMEIQVMVESCHPRKQGILAGTADRYVTVEFPGGPEHLDRLVTVVAQSAAEGRLLGLPRPRHNIVP
ncbi:MAG: tRNA (N(6)-L-threonylcarbamoyladenosine(37)-C(2))-methylthiotransferase MtaB [Thermoguttaceae bacterium]|jgi:threonylcarbamoyladenosine tRNA methylthiotransferase MtaB|nr:tRNA (N(6)-L-threonylcarbamoyladenosine(37)-C(2))-methylthiotransferase MtaB [Thermoguttaceae bacterium]